MSNYKELGKFITNARYLTDLNISWNSMKQLELFELIDVIVENKTLQSLNLSHNSLMNPQEELFSKWDAEHAAKYYEQQRAKKILMMRMTPRQREKYELEHCSKSMLAVRKLVKFIK